MSTNATFFGTPRYQAADLTASQVITTLYNPVASGSSTNGIEPICTPASNGTKVNSLVVVVNSLTLSLAVVPGFLVLYIYDGVSAYNPLPLIPMSSTRVVRKFNNGDGPEDLPALVLSSGKTLWIGQTSGNIINCHCFAGDA